MSDRVCLGRNLLPQLHIGYSKEDERSILFMAYVKDMGVGKNQGLLVPSEILRIVNPDKELKELRRYGPSCKILVSPMIAPDSDASKAQVLTDEQRHVLEVSSFIFWQFKKRS